MRAHGKGTNLKGEVDTNLIIAGHLCIFCTVDGMTEEEAELHAKSPEHLKQCAKMDRQIKEQEEEEKRDRELLDYLQLIDPLDVEPKSVG